MNNTVIQALSLLTNIYVTPEIGENVKTTCGEMIGKLVAMMNQDIKETWSKNYSSIIS